jgi:hypothetical protein
MLISTCSSPQHHDGRLVAVPWRGWIRVGLTFIASTACFFHRPCFLGWAVCGHSVVVLAFGRHEVKAVSAVEFWEVGLGKF